MSIQFIVSEEQTMVRDSVRRWVAQDHRVAGDPAGQWAIFAELGWLMIALPEEAGGLGGTVYDSAIIAEELGRGLVRAPFVEVTVAAAQLLLKLAPARVAAIADGSARPMLAHDEAAARGQQDWIETVAVQAGAGWALSGRKTGLVGIDLADRLLISARLPDGTTGIFELAVADAPLRRFKTIDDRAGAELLLDDTPASLVAAGAGNAIAAALDHALVVESAEALGAMQVALELTREYLLTRKQYGQRIGDFQALRHRLADMFIEVEQARSMVLRGLAALVDEAADRPMIVAATRARVAQAGHYVGAQAIQLHGGIGVAEEYPVGHYFKRLIAFENRHGTAATQVERYADLRAVAVGST